MILLACTAAAGKGAPAGIRYFMHPLPAVLQYYNNYLTTAGGYINISMKSSRLIAISEDTTATPLLIFWQRTVLCPICGVAEVSMIWQTKKEKITSQRNSINESSLLSFILFRFLLKNDSLQGRAAST